MGGQDLTGAEKWQVQHTCTGLNPNQNYFSISLQNTVYETEFTFSFKNSNVLSNFLLEISADISKDIPYDKH